MKLNRKKLIIHSILLLSTLFIIISLTVVHTVNSAASGTERKTVSVAYYDAGLMMSGAENGSVKSGYAYDYLQQISYITNWEFNYVCGTPEELYDRFLAGEIDLFPYMSYSDARNGAMLFPDQPMGEESFYLAASDQSSNIDINSEVSLNGLKIGIVEGLYPNKYLTDYLTANGINAEIVPFTTVEEKTRALRNGKIDLSYESTALSESDFFLVDNIVTKPFYCAVTESRKELLAELNVVLNTMEELDSDYITKLNRKYYNNSPFRKLLTDEEKEWLNAHPEFTIGVLGDSSAYCYKDENGEISGSVPEIINLMMSRLNVTNKLNYKFYPTVVEMHEALYNHEVDLITPEYHNYAEAEKNHLLISDPVFATSMGLLYTDADVSGATGMIFTSGTQLSSYYAHEYYPDAVVVLCDSVNECIKKVLNTPNCSTIAELSDLDNEVADYKGEYPITIIPLYGSCNICFSCNLEDGALIRLINRSIPLVNETEKNYLITKYVQETGMGFTAKEFFKRNPAFIALNACLIILIIIGSFILARLVKRHRGLEQSYSQAILKNAHSYFKVNLNKNLIVSPILEKVDGAEVDYSDKFGETLPDFETIMCEGADKFVDEADKESYKKFFSCEHLIGCFNRGEAIPEYSCHIYSSVLGWHFRRYSAFLSQNSDGSILAMIVAYDITKEMAAENEKKKLDEALNLAKQASIISAVTEDYSFVGLFNLANDSITIVHADDILQKYLNSMSKGEKGLLGSRAVLAKLVCPEDLKDFYRKAKKETILSNIAFSKVYNLETRLIIKGKELYYRIKFSSMKNDPDTLIVALINIDHQVRSEQERGKLEGYQRAQTFADTFLHSYVSAYYIDLNDYSRIVFHKSDIANMECFENPNYLEAITSYINSCVHEEDREKMLEASNPDYIRNRLRKDEMYSVYMRDISEKKTRWYRFEVNKGTDKNHAGISFTDVTDKLAEEEQQRMALEAAQNKAEAANNAKTVFLFNMSHDIRTPMNAIMGFTSMALNNIGSTGKVQDYLKKIDVSSKQLLSLINEVLEMSRIESGKIDFNEKPVSIPEHFEKMVSVMEGQAAEKGLKFRHKTRNITHGRVYADDVRLSKIAMNIISNAIKYTPTGGLVDYSLEEIPCGTPNYATYVFSVADTGIGMSEDFVKQLFEPFSREYNSTMSKVQGTGLGMSIVKNLVDMMSGTINVDSKPGGGTKVDITISFRVCDDELLSPEQETENAVGRLEGKRVLLVEDNELNREIAREMLNDHGLIVETADDGDIALDMIRQLIDADKGNYFDFILMDIQMPRMNGYTAAQAIRNICTPKGINIPIFATTANAFEEDRIKALKAGMNEHIPKPLNINRLLEIMTNYTNNK